MATTHRRRGVYGPGHGSVFTTGGDDDYYFAFLEFGRRSTNRQTYVCPMEFGRDGTIRPVKVSLEGVGALRKVRGPKPLTLQGLHASSVRPPLDVEPMKDPDCRRREYFVPAFAADGANGSRWMAADGDGEPWLVADLGRARRVERSEICFVRPTAGHAYRLEGSVDGTSWTTIGGHADRRMQSPHVDTLSGRYRFLRVCITDGEAGVWEWSVY